MDLVGHFRRMAQNSLWANDRLYRAVLALRPGEFEAPRVNFFPSIAATLNHVLSIDLFYLDMLEESGVGLRLFDRWKDFRDPARLAAAQAECDRRYLVFCGHLSAPDLERRVGTDRGEDGQVPERVGDPLAHVFQHDIHHRGQVHAMLAGTSIPPPQLDEYFLDFDLVRRRDEIRRLGIG